MLDAAGAEVAREPLALATATTLDVDAVVRLIHRNGGLAVAAHIDRRSFGVIGQLGFFPGRPPASTPSRCRGTWPPARRPRRRFREHGLPLVHCSDAHYLADIGVARTAVRCERPDFGELALALAGRDGRGLGDA